MARYGTPNYRPAAKQAWQTGQVVNVGFIKGLVVKERVATPGDSESESLRGALAAMIAKRTPDLELAA